MMDALAFTEDSIFQDQKPIWGISTASSTGIIRNLWEHLLTANATCDIYSKPKKFAPYNFGAHLEYDHQSVCPKIIIETSSSDHIIVKRAPTNLLADSIDFDLNDQDIDVLQYRRHRRTVLVKVLKRTRGSFPKFDEDDFLFD